MRLHKDVYLFFVSNLNMKFLELIRDRTQLLQRLTIAPGRDSTAGLPTFPTAQYPLDINHTMASTKKESFRASKERRPLDNLQKNTPKTIFRLPYPSGKEAHINNERQIIYKVSTICQLLQFWCCCAIQPLFSGGGMIPHHISGKYNGFYYNAISRSLPMRGGIPYCKKSIIINI